MGVTGGPDFDRELVYLRFSLYLVYVLASFLSSFVVVVFFVFLKPARLEKYLAFTYTTDKGQLNSFLPPYALGTHRERYSTFYKQIYVTLPAKPIDFYTLKTTLLSYRVATTLSPPEVFGIRPRVRFLTKYYSDLPLVCFSRPLED